MRALKCLSPDMEEMIKGNCGLLWNGQIIPVDFSLCGFLKFMRVEWKWFQMLFINLLVIS